MASSPLAPLLLVSPGYAGLNTQASASILGPEWASELRNVVFDDAGRPAARKGWDKLNATPITASPSIVQMFEYVPISGTKYVLSTTATDIFSGTSIPSSVKGAVAPSAGNWKFVNFNGSVYGLQASHPLISWNGTGNFAAVTAGSGSVPDGNCLLSAFGRLWGSSSDGQTLKYSGLLAATNWGSTGAGSINFTNVWANGQDNITALGSFNNLLVVFGTQNIIILEDNSGSTLGLDPTNIRVRDVISGIGCIARDSVQNVEGDDLVFLAATGVFGLRRILQDGGNPLRGLTSNVRDAVVYAGANTTDATVRSAYVAREGLYLLLFPTVNKIYALSTKADLPDGTWRVAVWDTFIPTSLAVLTDQATLYCGKTGTLYEYDGYLDDTSTYAFAYTSGWMSIGQEVQDRIKTLKRIGALVFASGRATVIFKWAFDFSGNFTTFQRQVVNSGVGSEYNVAEYSLGEYGESSYLHELEVPASGSGQFVKVGIQTTINDFSFALQLVQIFAKIGRMT